MMCTCLWLWASSLHSDAHLLVA